MGFLVSMAYPRSKRVVVNLTVDCSLAISNTIKADECVYKEEDVTDDAGLKEKEVSRCQQQEKR